MTHVVTRWGCLSLLLLALAGCKTANHSRSLAMEEAAASRSQLRGEAAPDFTLANHKDQPVRLAELRGQWVVLYFYPQDDTPGCTCQATEFTDLLSRFEEANATVLGISPDSPASHRHFRQKYGINITLLSDPDHRVMQPYGAWSPMGWKDRRIGRVVRSTFLIDPQGRVAWHWPEVIPQGHAQRVSRKLLELSAQAAARPTRRLALEQFP